MQPLQPAVTILTGPRQSVKTTLLLALLHNLRSKQLKVAGIIAEGLWQNEIRSGFNLIDLSDGVATPLCRRSTDGGPRQATPFVFCREGIAAGEKALSIERCIDADLVLVDEVGPLEIRGEGWAPRLAPLLELSKPVHLWVVRDTCLETVRDRWRLEHVEIVDVKETSALSRLKTFCLEHGKKGKDWLS
jgi:nucleoside-triphosphatase